MSLRMYHVRRGYVIRRIREMNVRKQNKENLSVTEVCGDELIRRILG